MAQRTVVTLVDDMTGEADDDVQTIEFAYKGVNYEIDLGEKWQQIFDESLADFVANARRTGGRQKRGTGKAAAKTSGSGYSRDTLKQMREWAAGQGYEVSPRGRIPGGVVTAWEEAHQGGNSGPHLAAVAEG